MEQPLPSTWKAIGRGVLGRCPNCGKGPLFRAYLKPIGNCPVCNEAYGHIRADDGPPWLTLVVVGHIIVPLAYWAERMVEWPLLVSISLWSTLSLILVLTLLPRAKGIFVAIVWVKKSPGSELS
jgi:uncharacterized protein (DUF983 family)